MQTQVSEEQVMEQLRKLMDPEVGINVVDLGLVEEVHVLPEGKVHLIMLVTSPGCPLQDTLQQGATRLLQELPGVAEAWVEIAHTPAWSPQRIAAGVLDSIG